MATSSTSEASRPLTTSEWVSTLPPWRRLLATFNWRPVYDIEMRELESEKRTKQIEKEIVLLEIENKRLAELEIQNGCLIGQCRFLLADTTLNRIQLSEALAVFLEDLRPPRG